MASDLDDLKGRLRAEAKGRRATAAETALGAGEAVARRLFEALERGAIGLAASAQAV